MAHAIGMNVQVLPKILTDAYTMFDSLNLSVTALVAIALVLTIVFLFAAREAASWFFKIDDLKQDLKKVRQSVVDMEAEVRMLQTLLTQNLQLASKGATTPLTERSTTDFEMDAAAAKAGTSQAAEAKPARFTVTH